MSVVQVQVMDQGRLGKLQALLAGVPGGAERAARSAAQRAASHLRTNSAKAIREKYDISAANIRSNEKVTVRYTHQQGVQAFVTFAGGKIPLFRYGGASPGAPAYDQSKLVPVMIRGQWRMAHPGLPAHGHQMKETAPGDIGADAPLPAGTGMAGPSVSAGHRGGRGVSPVRHAAAALFCGGNAHHLEAPPRRKRGHI